MYIASLYMYTIGRHLLGYGCNFQYQSGKKHKMGSSRNRGKKTKKEKQNKTTIKQNLTVRKYTLINEIISL